MDLTDTIKSIENKRSITEKCICYSEIILYLNNIKNSFYITDSEDVSKNLLKYVIDGNTITYKGQVDWKENIKNQLKQDVIDIINNNINELKELIKLNVGD